MPLDKVVRDANVRLSQYYGPAPRANCPCGSGRPSRRCHRAEDHSWIAKRSPALLTDERTGYANPGCYGRSSNDCSEDLTLEHYISDDVLESIAADGKVISVRGAAWLGPGNPARTVGVKSLSARMLCGRHNHALSPLDAMASDYFRYFREDQLDLMKFQGNDCSRGFVMVNGPRMELWMLKVLWGAIESKALTLDGRRAYRFRLGVTSQQLAEILWRGADWPPAWGMYVLYDLDQDEPVKQNSVRISLASMGSEVLGGFIQIAGFELLIAFETPSVAGRYFRPGGLVFTRVGFPVQRWKLAVFAWPELGHEIIRAVSQVPPNVDFTAPPNPRAARLQNLILPGSLNVASGSTTPQQQA
jgi:hypothetical protein